MIYYHLPICCSAGVYLGTSFTIAVGLRQLFSMCLSDSLDQQVGWGLISSWGWQRLKSVN